MFDSFPYDSWLNEAGDATNDAINGFWTFGPGNSTGTYILTVLGIILLVGSLVGWVWLDDQKLRAQAAVLRAAGGLGLAPAPSGPVHGAAPSQPPLAGPSTDPGD